MPDDALSKTGRLLVQTGLFRNSVALPLCNLLIMQQITSGCRVFPDEEGTESLIWSRARTGPFIVAEYSPMNRGLKGAGRSPGVARPASCRVFPDEEGTESIGSGGSNAQSWRCRVFPDEEGTERPAPRRARANWCCCRVFPDEEGTESADWSLARLPRRALQSIPR